uniref:Uncharacterized protein n=1 Tax=Anguilla anguilla TaxID=7936 RepID=A0A0E9VT33_ANGAN
MSVLKYMVGVLFHFIRSIDLTLATIYNAIVSTKVSHLYKI